MRIFITMYELSLMNNFQLVMVLIIFCLAFWKLIDLIRDVIRDSKQDGKK